MIKKYPYDFTKSTVDVYRFRAQGAPFWADITIDSPKDGACGRISIASDFGNWSYYWGACGSPFREFLAKCDQHYIAKNFGADKFFDSEYTIASYLNQVENVYFTKEDKALATREIGALGNYINKEEFVHHVMNSPLIMGMWDGTPDICFDLDPGFKNFWEHIWPLLLEEFKKEVPRPDSPTDVYYLCNPNIEGDAGIIGGPSIMTATDAKMLNDVLRQANINDRWLHKSNLTENEREPT